MFIPQFFKVSLLGKNIRPLSLKVWVVLVGRFEMPKKGSENVKNKILVLDKYYPYFYSFIQNNGGGSQGPPPPSTLFPYCDTNLEHLKDF